MSRTATIERLIALINHPTTPEPERETAQHLLEGLRKRAKAEGQDTDSGTWTGYRPPPVAYGSKYEGYLPSAEIARRIRNDIKLLRKLGAKAAKEKGAVKLADPIADAPASIKFSVRKYDYSGGRTISVSITGVPADWWVEHYNPEATWRIPGPQLKALREAVADVMWAYNFDGSDSQTDLFYKNFIARISADGDGDGYPRDI